MYRHIIFILFFVIGVSAVAQEMKVIAPQTVYEGQRFSVRFEVNDRASNFRGPSFKGFSSYGGPSTMNSSSTQYVNGKMSRQVTTTFSYTLMADKVGTFSIGSASCTVDDKQLTSQPFTIKVEKASAQQQQAQQGQNNNGGYVDPWDEFFNDPWGNGQSQRQQRQQPHQEQPATIDSKSLFTRATISKSNLYQGEQAIIIYKIYTQVSIQQFQIDKLPGNKGFWAEDLSEGKELKQYEETIDGRRYHVAEIRRGALFAQENGQLRIAPLDIDVLAMVPQQRRRTGTIWDIFDDPFFNRAQAVEKHLSTNAISVNVKPLPPAPDGFCGAVGSYEVTADVDNNTVRANEAITYRITINGSGNLMLINEPKVDFGNAFEVYDPQVKDKITRGDGGISGSRTYEWVVIPRSQGDYEIPAVRFAYFDPKSGRYVEKTLPAVALHVEKGDPSSMRSVSSAKSDVKVINNDINYIKTGGALAERGRSAAIGLWFWLLLAVIVAAGVTVIAVGRKRQSDERDIAGTRLRRATREARRRLKQAARHLDDGNDNAFYEEIYKAIWGCLSDKFSIPLSSLSSDTVRDILTEHKIAEDKREHILRTLADVDFARFAPGDPAERKHQIYDEALQMIAAL